MSVCLMLVKHEFNEARHLFLFRFPWWLSTNDIFLRFLFPYVRSRIGFQCVHTRSAGKGDLVGDLFYICTSEEILKYEIETNKADSIAKRIFSYLYAQKLSPDARIRDWGNFDFWWAENLCVCVAKPPGVKSAILGETRRKKIFVKYLEM